MNLLSDSAYWLAGILAVLALTGAGWLTSRTPRRWPGALTNMLVVSLAGALITTAVGLVLNRQNGWYAHPRDLVRNHSTSTTHKFGADSPFTEAAAPAAAGPANLPELPEPGNRVQTFTVPTSEGHQKWRITVVLPADYFEPGSADRTYPVVYAGHGAPGGPDQYLGVFDLPKMADAAVAERRIRPFIIVIPTITPGGADTECITGPDGVQQLEHWLARDVPAYVQKRLRVVPDRASRAWLGFSLGGWCGTMLTMRYPETFGAAASLGGYYQPWWTGAPPWPEGDARTKQYDLTALTIHRPPAVALWIQSSRKDSQSWPRTEGFLKAVRPPTALTAVIDDSGGHNFSGWVGHGSAILTWMGQNVPGFAPL